MFCLVKAHLTASNKGELANRNAAYKIIAVEFSMTGKRSQFIALKIGTFNSNFGYWILALTITGIKTL